MMTLRKEKRKIDSETFIFLLQIDNNRKEHHVEPTSLNGYDDEDESKSLVTFSITADAIRKSQSFMKHASDSNNNYNKSEAESPEYFPPADQNNNDSEVKKHFGESRISKLRNHRMQQLLQQHVFTPHQVNLRN